VPLNAIRDVMGHKTTAMTERYAMQPMKEREELWKQFNPLSVLSRLKSIATILPQSKKGRGS